VVLDDPEVMMWGGELLLCDGAAGGLVTSAAWGATIGASVALAYLRHPDGEPVTPQFARASHFEINVGGRICPASVSLRPPFDPDGEKVHR
jgi:4-methylaminobutanoate oxidase (formaldehyde-forming)